MSEGPITHTGIHPITGKAGKVVADGKKGAEHDSKPKASQIGGAGAKPGGGGGKHMKEGKQEKSMASVFYPKDPGLRGVG